MSCMTDASFFVTSLIWCVSVEVYATTLGLEGAVGSAIAAHLHSAPFQYARLRQRGGHF
jgi:hypothetical protein